jgi:hypothetical protein
MSAGVQNWSLDICDELRVCCDPPHMQTRLSKPLRCIIAVIIGLLSVGASASASSDPLDDDQKPAPALITPENRPIMTHKAFSAALRGPDIVIEDQTVNGAWLTNVVIPDSVNKVIIRRCTIVGDTSLRVAESSSINLWIEECKFTGSVLFNNTESAFFQRIRGNRTAFAGYVAVEDPPSEMQFHNSEFTGGVHIYHRPTSGKGGLTSPRSSTLTLMGSVFASYVQFEYLRATVEFGFAEGPMTIFRGPVLLREISGGMIRFGNANFGDLVTVVDCQLSDVWLQDAIFSNELRIDSTRIKEEFRVSNAVFSGGLTLAWRELIVESDWPAVISELRGQPQTKVKGAASSFEDFKRVAGPDAWRRLEAAWRTSGDLEAANEASYQRQLLANPRGLAWAAWGYGYRPWRIAFWIGVLIGIFAGLYGTQMHELPARQRVVQAIVFSARAAWEWRFGWQHTRSPWWRAVTVVEQISFKVLLLLFAQALANTSPLLRLVFGKLIPM